MENGTLIIQQHSHPVAPTLGNCCTQCFKEFDNICPQNIRRNRISENRFQRFSAFAIHFVYDIMI